MIYECEICGKRSKHVITIKKCEQTTTAIRVLRGGIFRTGTCGNERTMACLGYRVVQHSIEARCLYINRRGELDIGYFTYTNKTPIHIAFNKSDEYKKLEEYMLSMGILKVKTLSATG